MLSTCFAFHSNIAYSGVELARISRASIVIKQWTEDNKKHRKPDFIFKYFSVLKTLLRFACIDAFVSTEKTIFNKIKSKTKSGNNKNLHYVA